MVDSLLQPNSLILVAFVPMPRDLEVARVLGWYRIPLRTAPKIVSVDFLAFYQPASFGDHKWCIESIAPVLGHELVTRSELIRDEPDHPKGREEYFKIQLGPLMYLSTPIHAGKWKRITFFYTTGEYLMAAETLNDLVVHSNERKTLWQSLSERAEQGYECEMPDVDIALDDLVEILGIKGLLER